MTSSQLLISGEGSERGSRYYILSKKLAVKKFAATVKGHWAIENELHWQLEVTFRADHCRIRKGNADANFSTLRRTALTLLKNEKTAKLGVKNKRLEHFRSVSPAVLAEQHAESIKHGSLIRMVCGAQDETFANNRDFHEHLERLGIAHTWIVLPGVDHDPLRTLAGLTAANWGFYRQAFAEPPERESPARTPDVDLSFRVRQQDRRAVIVNAPADGTKRPAVIVLHGGMMTFVYAVARPERLAAIAPVVASMFTFDAKPSVPLPILIINGAKDEEVPIEGGMSRNSIVRRGQQAPFKPLAEVVQFWVGVNRSQEEPQVETRGTVTTTVHAATPDGAATEFVVDSAGGHGWPGSKPRREGTKPISSFSGAERVWSFSRTSAARP
jgi:poly(3-hydroxybutyrate) depolymerase